MTVSLTSIYDPITKSSIKLGNRMDGGGFFHINDRHPLFRELRRGIGYIHDIAFKTKVSVRVNVDQFKIETLWVKVVCINMVGQNEQSIRVNGLFFKEWTDNFSLIASMHNRRNQYGSYARENRSSSVRDRSHSK